MYIPVKDTNFVKDTNTKALLTVNRSVLVQNEARKKLGQKLNSKNDEINKLKEDVETINQDLSEIKFLLKQLLDKKE